MSSFTPTILVSRVKYVHALEKLKAVLNCQRLFLVGLKNGSIAGRANLFRKFLVPSALLKCLF